MELRQLRTFVTIVEELSFSRAAQRLHVAQPALSVQIKALEEELGIKLLERNSRSVRLTPEGAVFLIEAQQVLAAARRAQDQAHRARHGLIGTLRIGVIAPAANTRLAAALRSYRAAFPEVDLFLNELTSSQQIESLLAEQIDVAFVRPPVDHAELATYFLEEVPMGLAVYAGHKLARAKTIRWQDFDGEALVVVAPHLQHGYYDRFLARCAEAGARPVIRQYANDVQTILWLVSAGLGITPATLTLSEIKRPGLLFRPLPDGMPKVQTLVAWRRNNQSPLLAEFLQRVKAGFPA
jgi:DNA-binding transcriptional LysR family regulator